MLVEIGPSPDVYGLGEQTKPRLSERSRPVSEPNVKQRMSMHIWSQLDWPHEGRRRVLFEKSGAVFASIG